MTSNEIIKERISKKLKEIIKERKTTQTEIAKEIGTSQAIISDYIKKKKAPAIEIFAKICEVYEIEYEEILELLGIEQYKGISTNSKNTFNITTMRDINIKK